MLTFARRWRLSNQRIHTKFTLILTLPLLAVLTLAGLGATSVNATATRHERARQLLVLGTTASELADRLRSERVAAALALGSGTDAKRAEEYRRRTATADTAIQRFRDQRRRVSAENSIRSSLSRIDEGLNDLRSVRQRVLAAPDTVANVVTPQYQVIITEVSRLREALSHVDVVAGVGGRSRAAATLGDAATALGVTQAAMVRSLAAGHVTPAAHDEIVAADTEYRNAVEAFRHLAPAAWISRFERMLTSSEALTAERLYGVAVRALPGPVPALGTGVDGWTAAVAAQTGLLSSLAAEFDAQLIADVERWRDSAQRDLWALTGGVAIAVFCAIALCARASRSLRRSLVDLRVTVEDFAQTQLPEMVAQVSAVVDLEKTRRLVAQIAEPIPVRGNDEVGQVAAAFNAVTASAVRLAGEQAALRSGVRAIFNSLSRRSQRRLDTVMTSIDVLQAKETDPDQLSLLFRLDHAATGLRRLTAGLQILAGGRAGLARARPMVLADVLRAAQSEIDQYQRIDLGRVDDDVRLRGETVEEVIHLLAELLDNAARFSEPSTLVVVEGGRVGDRLHVQITDSGKGMTAAQLAAARDRIANPHRLDHHAAQQMGMPVVSAIAGRLGISVELRPVVPHGTRVDLTLPPALFEVVSSDLGRSAPEAETIPADRVPDDGEATVNLMELESGWRSALSWPSAAATEPTRFEPAREPARSEPAEPIAAETASSEPTPEMYQRLKHAWFAGSDMVAPSGVGFDAPEPTELTQVGLPKRRGGAAMPSATEDETDQAGQGTDRPAGWSRKELPPTAPPADDGPPARGWPGERPGSAPSQADPRRDRDSDQLRLRYAGLQRGLMATRRRSASSLPEEEQQP